MNNMSCERLVGMRGKEGKETSRIDKWRRKENVVGVKRMDEWRKKEIIAGEIIIPGAEASQKRGD